MKVGLNTSGIVGKLPKDSKEFYKFSQAKFWKEADLKPSELAAHIVNGFAWMCAVIDDDKPSKSAKYCNYTESLALDIDSGLTMGEALENDFIKKYCALIIPSSSHTPEHHKFRIVFPLPYALTTSEMINAGYSYLLSIFPCGDKACKNSDRFFYGAKEAKPFYINDDAVLPLDFFDHVSAWQSEKQKKAAARDLTKFNALCEDADQKERIVISALGMIPKREIGAGTYPAVRDAIWALCDEYGEAKAITIMEQHSPSYSSWNVEKIASKFDASRGITLGTLFYHASQYGFSFPSKSQVKNWKPSISKKLAAIPESKDKKFFVSLADLADRRTKRTIQGLGEYASKDDVIAAYLELRALQNILEKHQDTFTEDKASEILEKLCNFSHFDFESIKAEIKARYNLSDLKPAIYENGGNDGIEAHLKLWRKKYFEVDPSKDPKTEKDRVDALLEKEREYLRIRVTQKARDGIRYHAKFHTWYGYKNGIYKRLDPERITALVRELLTDLGCEGTDKTIKEYVSKFRDETITDSMDIAPKHLIPFLDGVLDRRSMQLLPHDKKHLFTWSLPYRWCDRSKASAQPIIDWLKSALDDDNQVRLVLCFLNMAIVGRRDIHRFLELVGAGGTGKSTLLTLFTAITGQENTRATTLNQLENNRFETANFYGKKLLTISENDKYRGSVENLKRITGRDPLRYEEKNKQCAPDFEFSGLVVSASNYTLNGEDKSSGLDRRRCTLPMNKVVPIPLRKNLISREDEGFTGKFAPSLPALIELVLNIPDKAVKNYCDDTLHYVPSLKATKQKTLIETNKIADWLENNCVFLETAKTKIGSAPKITVSEKHGDRTASRTYTENNSFLLYANYSQFCLDCGVKPTSLTLFSRELVDLCNNQLGVKTIKHLKTRLGAFVEGIAIRDASNINLPNPISNCEDLLGLGEDSVRTQTFTVKDCEDCEDFFKFFTQEKNNILDMPIQPHTNINTQNTTTYKDCEKSPNSPNSPTQSGFESSQSPHTSPHTYAETTHQPLTPPLPVNLNTLAFDSRISIEEPLEKPLTQGEITDLRRLAECRDLGIEASLHDSWIKGTEQNYIETRDAKLKELKRKAAQASQKLENSSYF